MSIAETDRLLDLAFLRHSVVAELSNRRGAIMATNMGENLRLMTTLMG